MHRIRDVWKEIKPQPFSRMRKGQLIRLVEVMEEARDRIRTIPEPETTVGRPGLRRIPIATMEIEGESIRVPLFPALRKKA